VSVFDHGLSLRGAACSRESACTTDASSVEGATCSAINALGQDALPGDPPLLRGDSGRAVLGHRWRPTDVPATPIIAAGGVLGEAGDLAASIPRTAPGPPLVIIVGGIKLYPPELPREGGDPVPSASAASPSTPWTPASSPLNYMNNILAKIEAKRAEPTEPVLLQPTRGSDRGVQRRQPDSWVTGGVLADAGNSHPWGPPGITRACVLELAASLEQIPRQSSARWPCHDGLQTARRRPSSTPARDARSSPPLLARRAQDRGREARPITRKAGGRLPPHADARRRQGGLRGSGLGGPSAAAPAAYGSRPAARLRGCRLLKKA
jgi:hypothetical protein